MRNATDIPGFVDLQVNGYAGVDFSSPDLTEDAFIAAVRRLRAEGTAVFLPTLITSPQDIYERNLPLIVRAIDRAGLGRICPGIHLEGPFISPLPGAVGAHDARWVRRPDPRLLRRLFELADGRIRLLTLAPELARAAELARFAVAAGATVSAGHTMAGPDDLDRFFRAGARALTHLGNGVPQMLPKFGNPIWAGLADDRYTAMLIADGHHIPPGPLKAMLRVKGTARVVVTSDASPPAGLPPGRYRALGNDIVIHRDGSLRNPEKGCFVGSSATMLHCINHLASLDLLSPAGLTAVGFANPLRLVGLRAAAVPPERLVRFDRATGRFVATAHAPRTRPVASARRAGHRGVCRRTPAHTGIARHSECLHTPAHVHR